MGVCLITAVTDDDLSAIRARYTGAGAGNWGRSYQPLQAHPAPAWPRFPDKPRYADPAKPRSLDQVVAEYTKLQDRAFEDQRGIKGRVEDQRGKTHILPGYGMAVSDGCFAWGVPTDQPCTGAMLGRAAVACGRLRIEAWRDYAPLRPIAYGGLHTIRWNIGADRIRWTAAWDGDEASSWTPGAFTNTGDSIKLDDRYLWPCRGRAWDLAVCPNGIVLTDPDGAGCLIVMGIRD